MQTRQEIELTHGWVPALSRAGPLRRLNRRRRRATRSAPLDPRPQPLDFIWLEVTGRCNLECVHCYASSHKLAEDHLGTDVWISMLRQGSEAGCKGVQFIGGEPTVFRDLLLLIEESRNLGYEYVELFTNATQLSDDLLDQLKAYDLQVATSFYSHVPAIHDSVTRTIGSFEGTVGGITRLVGKGIPLRVGLIRLPQNARDLEATADFLVELGVPRERVLVDRVRGHGRAEMIVNEHNEYSGLCGHCGDGRLAVAYDGSVYPCVHARRFKLGNAFQDPLEKLAESEQLVEFRRSMIANLDDHVRKALIEDPEPCRGL